MRNSQPFILFVEPEFLELRSKNSFVLEEVLQFIIATIGLSYEIKFNRHTGDMEYLFGSTHSTRIYINKTGAYHTLLICCDSKEYQLKVLDYIMTNSKYI